MSSSLVRAWAVVALIASFTAAAGESNSAATADGRPLSGDFIWSEQAAATWAYGRTEDIVGDTSNSGTASGRAKGNSYQVDIDVLLEEMEFWLNFSTTQTLTYYVFHCPDEFGTYTEVFRESGSVSGTGPGWYSSGPVAIDLSAGSHYIIAVSWDGSLTYYYGTGDSQAVSFGYHTHGYATGYDPLPASFQSMSNDQAIYHQRLSTSTTALEHSTWAGIKVSF